MGLQPSRGVHENPEKAYHDKELSLHHQYIAFYKYIREEFKADVIVHFINFIQELFLQFQLVCKEKILQKIRFNVIKRKVGFILKV
ncbi:cobaltochelatase subunit CobN [Clostridium sp. Marseille-Q7071]